MERLTAILMFITAVAAMSPYPQLLSLMSLGVET